MLRHPFSLRLLLQTLTAGAVDSATTAFQNARVAVPAGSQESRGHGGHHAVGTVKLAARAKPSVVEAPSSSDSLLQLLNVSAARSLQL